MQEMQNNEMRFVWVEKVLKSDREMTRIWVYKANMFIQIYSSIHYLWRAFAHKQVEITIGKSVW